MARRRKDPESKKDWSFEVPEFDEDEYIRKETISFRTTLILFVYSILTAGISFLVWLPLNDNPTGAWLAGLAVGGVLGYLLRYIYAKLKVDIEHFGKKEWTGTGFLYFFSWLAFFLFLTNPPIYDGVEPVVEIHISPDAQTPGNPVVISVLAFDNVKVDHDGIKFSVTGPNGERLADHRDFNDVGYDIEGWQWQDTFTTTGTYTVTAQIGDVNGRVASKTRTFEVDEDAVQIAISGGGTISTKLDVITVEVPATVDAYRVTLHLLDEDSAGGHTEVLMERAPDEDNLYTVNSEAPGFQAHYNKTQNLTMRFHAVVEEHDSYFLHARYGIDTDDGHLRTHEVQTVTFADDGLLSGDDATKEPKRRAIEPQQTPGPGAIVVAIGAVAVLAIARRRPDQ